MFGFVIFVIESLLICCLLLVLFHPHHCVRVVLFSKLYFNYEPLMGSLPAKGTVGVGAMSGSSQQNLKLTCATWDGTSRLSPVKF